MGRKKKVVEVVEGADVVAPEVKPAKKEPYSLYAWFAYIDKEGFKIKSEHRSEGDTVAELLQNMEFPKGCNCLVNVTVKHGNKEISKAIAPHKARAILELKSVEAFSAGQFAPFKGI